MEHLILRLVLPAYLATFCLMAYILMSIMNVLFQMGKIGEIIAYLILILTFVALVILPVIL
jgi:hypothetical protein